MSDEKIGDARVCAVCSCRSTPIGEHGNAHGCPNCMCMANRSESRRVTDLVADALEASVQEIAALTAEADRAIDQANNLAGDVAVLQSSVQAPSAVDREALFGLIAQSLATDGGQAFAPRGGNAWRSAEGIVTVLFASGILQDAAVLEREAEARGLEKFAQELLSRVGPPVKHRGSGAVFEFSPKGTETEFWGYENAVAYTGAVLEVLDLLGARPENLTATTYAGGRAEPRTLDEAVAELRAQQVREGTSPEVPNEGNATNG